MYSFFSVQRPFHVFLRDEFCYMQELDSNSDLQHIPHDCIVHVMQKQPVLLYSPIIRPLQRIPKMLRLHICLIFEPILNCLFILACAVLLVPPTVLPPHILP